MQLKSLLSCLGLFACLTDSGLTAVQAQTAPVKPSAITRLRVAEEKAFSGKIELPDLPEYTGKAKLETGVQSAATDDVDQSITLVYQAKEDSGTIINWYRTVLTMYKWDISSSTNRAVIATNPNSGNSCSIYCDNESPSGCKLHVSYAFLKKDGTAPATGSNY